MPYITKDLPYAYNALEPYIDAKTMEIHHDKHHAAYTSKLNAAVEKYPDLAKRPPEDLIANLSSVPQEVRAAVRNNGGGHVNHEIFWSVLGKGKAKPEGDLAKAIDKAFGSFEKFKEEFSNAALTQFGSGWAWLIVKKDGALAVTKTPNQDSPTAEDAAVQGAPILNLDVWEHAYYLKYQNRRPEYIDAFWNVINWDAVAKLYAAAKK